MAELGPIDGWRCARERVYTYDPRWPHFDAGLLPDKPERDIANAERVELNLRSGQAIVSASVDGKRRVYVVEPGRLTMIGPCAARLADWRVVSEQNLD
jgi:hypothetical protein